MPMNIPVTHRATTAAIAMLFAATAASVPEPLTSSAHGIDFAGIDHTVQPGADFSGMRTAVG
jgi:hypothetical protein